MRAQTHRTYFLPAAGSLVALAWVTLWLWSQSPYGRYLDHSQLGELNLASGVGGLVVPASLYVAGWTLMVAAMMLPTTLPLLELFHRLIIRRPDRGQLLGLVIAGYVTTWLAFGVAAHLADWVLHQTVERFAWLDSHAWIIGAGVIALAGAFQFTSLKYRCLDKCRSPLSFIMEHWRGRWERTHAFWLGAHNGLFCVGCCWALMLLMFAVGVGNVGWMLALGAAMAIEKNMPWGRKLSAPLGIALLAWGTLILVHHSWSL